ncbi:hypothetical protein B0H14DRAFT_2569319 [Mycena olivaceomarginata]|nr:hypothetical protein B0H14DRAFT_2569319 [Mycena olivaceomarginata]
MLLSTNDIAGLRRTLTVQLKRGASAQAIASLLQHIVDGSFAPRGGFWDSISLPQCVKTKTIPKLLPSIGVPTLEEINWNIENFLAAEIKPPPTPNANGKLPGNILMFDGVSLESKCRYCPEEHSYRVKTKVESFDSIEQVRVALFEPETEEEKKGKELAAWMKSCHAGFLATGLVVTVTRPDVGDATGPIVTVTVAS